MEIQHQHHLTNGEFFLKDEQQQKLAVMTYVMVNDSTMLIEHTIVDESLGGQGIGKKLVDAGVQFARTKSYKIIPQCPYANAVFKKTPEYADVWKTPNP
jgi:predicted GNAT family acetyltransferase